MKNRTTILNLLSERDNSTGMEIGVWNGDFSEQILKQMAPSKLYLVDPWQHDPRYPERRYGKSGADEMEQRFQSVRRRFAHESRVEIRRTKSDEVWNNIEPLDWVYIDGNHSYEYVLADLEGADSRLKPGGLIAGDDCHLPPDTRWRGVFDALVSFLRSERGKNYTVEVLDNKQFAIRKPKAESATSTGPLRENERRLFAILSEPRSGTHLLRSLLSSHPAIRCEGEVFHPRIGFPHLSHLCDATPAAEVVDFLWNREENRGRTVGFAVHDSGGPLGRRFGWKHETLAELPQQPFLVWLHRENRLAQYASWLVALDSGRWSDYSGRRSGKRKPHNGPFSPNPEKFRKWLVSQEGRRQSLQSHLADIPSTSVSYEELSRDPNLICNKIFASLGLPPFAVETRTHKQRGYRLPQIFSNFEELLTVCHEESERFPGLDPAKTRP